MCELFALSSRLPASVRYSFAEFARRGGVAAPHADGWGLAHYADGDVRLLREPDAAAQSPCTQLLQQTPIVTDLLVSHIRLATRGARLLRNTQPFVRELGGRVHVFAHNGHFDSDRLGDLLRGAVSRPVGDTDSERAFCVLIERMRPLWQAGDGVPPLASRVAVVCALAAELRALGPANFLYADGDALFVHAHRRTQADKRITPPGLHLLLRRCSLESARMDVPGLTITAAVPEQAVALVASVPLSAEAGWQPLGEGEVLAIRGGCVIDRCAPEAVERAAPPPAAADIAR